MAVSRRGAAGIDRCALQPSMRLLDRRADQCFTAAMATRLYGYLISTLLLAAVCYPFTWPLWRDSFPLSNYPMFSRKLPAPTVTLEYALGLAPDGSRHYLAPALVANEEVLQARAVLSRAVALGSGATASLCQRIATRVAQAGAALAEVAEVRIVTGRHDAVAYLTGRDSPAEERVHGHCQVPRRP